MLKVMVFDRCEFCDGEAYVYSGERVDEDGSRRPIYSPCYMCKGSGEMEKLVTLQELQRMLDNDVEIEVGHVEPTKAKSVKQYQDSPDTTGI